MPAYEYPQRKVRQSRLQILAHGKKDSASIRRRREADPSCGAAAAYEEPVAADQKGNGSGESALCSMQTACWPLMDEVGIVRERPHLRISSTSSHGREQLLSD